MRLLLCNDGYLAPDCAQIKLCKSRGQPKASLRAFCIVYICLSAISSSMITKTTLCVAPWSVQIVSWGHYQARLKTAGIQHIHLAELPIEQPDPVLKMGWRRKNTHGRANARAFTVRKLRIEISGRRSARTRNYARLHQNAS
jgi:hypothetical protein